jgi:hypothetical protein
MFSQEFFRIAATYFEFQNIGNTTDVVGPYTQHYAQITAQQIQSAARYSGYSIGEDSDPDFVENIRTHIRQIGGQRMLCAAYFSAPGVISDYQFGISETVKVAETQFDCANRGLIEEAGLQFIPGAQQHPAFYAVNHTQTRGKGAKQKVQTCTTFYAPVALVQAATVASCQPVVGMINTQDYHGVVNGVARERKTQIIIYGTQQDLEARIGQIALKPTRSDGSYYDEAIKGIVIANV